MVFFHRKCKKIVQTKDSNIFHIFQYLNSLIKTSVLCSLESFFQGKLVILIQVLSFFQLPKFYLLCEDGVWGVRKACAECFMTVSGSCSPEVRKTELSGLFVNLLCDQSRWVRIL